jgi:hypothetical protein
MNSRQRAHCHDQTIVRTACEGIDAAFDLLVIAHINRIDLHLEQWSHGLDGGK